MSFSPALQNGLTVAALSTFGTLPAEVVVKFGIDCIPTSATNASVVPDRSPRRKACFRRVHVPVRHAAVPTDEFVKI